MPPLIPPLHEHPARGRAPAYRAWLLAWWGKRTPHPDPKFQAWGGAGGRGGMAEGRLTATESQGAILRAPTSPPEAPLHVVSHKSLGPQCVAYHRGKSHPGVWMTSLTLAKQRQDPSLGPHWVSYSANNSPRGSIVWSPDSSFRNSGSEAGDLGLSKLPGDASTLNL